MELHASYDVIIVGAGISGLYCAREIAKKNPSWKIALAERYKGLGGRTYSYSPPDTNIIWEMGAGRIRKDHTMVMNLIKEYDLTWVPIGEDITFKKSGYSPIEVNIFDGISIPIYLEPLCYLDPKILATHTIKELLVDIHGDKKTNEILSEFPYWAEIYTMRADIALKGFLGNGEMSSHEGYGILAEGFSELVKRLREDIESRGVIILNRHKLIGIKSSESKTVLTFEFGYPEKEHGKIQLLAEKSVILALHRDAVAELTEFKSWPMLKKISMKPLLRIYAVFDQKDVWFKDLKRVVTPGTLRYILPINPKKGVIMVSYTDGNDTKKYMNIQHSGGDVALEKAVLNDLRALFPDRHIPKPILFKSHPWESGASYWLPGLYNPEEATKDCIHPLPDKLPNVWLCGESWCMRQAWVEGALEHTQQCLDRLFHS